MTLRITDVEAIYLRAGDIQQRTDSSQDALLVRISTDAGIVGYGEVDSSPNAVRAIIEAPPSHTRAQGLRDLLVGEDPFATGSLWEKMRQGTLYYGRSGVVIQAMAGIDLALWDIKGKALNTPVYELLGGAFRTQVPAYASHMFEFTPEATAERARRAVDDGFRAVKFGWEPFGADPDLDVRLVGAIRDAVGNDVDVMIDAGLVWDAKTAIERCRLLERFDMRWLEEPLPPDDLLGYQRLSNAVSTRIAAGEEECTYHGFRQLIEVANIDVVQVDVTRVGLTEAVHVARLAAEHGRSVANHNFTTDINTAASLHLLAAIPNALILEYCVESNPLRDTLIRNPVKIVDGTAIVPQEPGLGVEIDEETVARYRVD